jgi:hypothetical protein
MDNSMDNNVWIISMDDSDNSGDNSDDSDNSGDVLIITIIDWHISIITIIGDNSTIMIIAGGDMMCWYNILWYPIHVIIMSQYYPIITIVVICPSGDVLIVMNNNG